MTMTTVAAASLSAGAIHSQLGWEALSLAALGPLTLVCAGLLWLGFVTGREKAKAA